MARYLVPVILIVGIITGGTYMFLSGGVSRLKEKVQALEAGGLTVETSSWAAFLIEYPPSTQSSHWVGARAYRYEYQFDDWEVFLDLAKGAHSVWEFVYGPGHFVVHYDKKAGKLWYLMPFEANILTDSFEYNIVFQWVG